MRLIGLCGRSGSGKGYFSDIARKNGFYVIDCDAVYKELVSRPSLCLQELESAFGSGIIKDNALDRRSLAPIVFSDKEKLKLLNTITHKHIREEVVKIISSQSDNTVFVLDAPTLFESGFDSMCELVIGILAPDDACIDRIVKRDNISEKDAIARLNNQLTQDKLIENCDYIIYNDSSLEEFSNATLDLLDKIREGVV